MFQKLYFFALKYSWFFQIFVKNMFFLENQEYFKEKKWNHDFFLENQEYFKEKNRNPGTFFSHFWKKVKNIRFFSVLRKKLFSRFWKKNFEKIFFQILKKKSGQNQHFPIFTGIYTRLVSTRRVVQFESTGFGFASPAHF